MRSAPDDMLGVFDNWLDVEFMTRAGDSVAELIAAVAFDVRAAQMERVPPDE